MKTQSFRSLSGDSAFVRHRISHKNPLPLLYICDVVITIAKYAKGFQTTANHEICAERAKVSPVFMDVQSSEMMVLDRM